MKEDWYKITERMERDLERFNKMNGYNKAYTHMTGQELFSKVKKNEEINFAIEYFDNVDLNEMKDGKSLAYHLVNHLLQNKVVSDRESFMRFMDSYNASEDSERDFVALVITARGAFGYGISSHGTAGEVALAYTQKLIDMGYDLSKKIEYQESEYTLLGALSASLSDDCLKQVTKLAKVKLHPSGYLDEEYMSHASRLQDWLDMANNKDIPLSKELCINHFAQMCSSNHNTVSRYFFRENIDNSAPPLKASQKEWNNFFIDNYSEMLIKAQKACSEAKTAFTSLSYKEDFKDEAFAEFYKKHQGYFEALAKNFALGSEIDIKHFLFHETSNNSDRSLSVDGEMLDIALVDYFKNTEIEEINSMGFLDFAQKNALSYISENEVSDFLEEVSTNTSTPLRILSTYKDKDFDEDLANFVLRELGNSQGYPLLSQDFKSGFNFNENDRMIEFLSGIEDGEDKEKMIDFYIEITDACRDDLELETSNKLSCR